MLDLNVLSLALATSAASVTISKTKITEAPRKWLWEKKWGMLAYLADCPYCVSHWIALVLVLTSFPWVGFLPFIITLGTVIAISAMSIGVIMKLMGWDQRDLDSLRDRLEEKESQLLELGEIIQTLSKHD
jgi:hypothetical protein